MNAPISSGAAALLAVALTSPTLGAQAAAGPAAQSGPDSGPPKVVLESSAAAGVEVHSLTIPWGPQTFAAMEAPGDSFYSKRTWPFARLSTTTPVEMEGTRLLPGNYALVFHPNNMQNEGMRLEVLKIEAGEFLQPGNALTRTPPGESVLKVPVRFGTTGTTTPSLKVGLTDVKSEGRLRLDVQYGDRTLARELKVVP